MNKYAFDWGELAFESKKPLRELKATFIAAPREMSEARFTQLIKEYLPKGPIVLGLAKEVYIDGFDGQAQFKTVQYKQLQKLIEKVNSSSPVKIYTLSYFQRELVTIVEKVKFKAVLFVNGSWHYSFHTLPIYYALVNSEIDFKLISPFANEDEAREYEQSLNNEIGVSLPDFVNSEIEVMEYADKVAKQSYDYGFQTGTVLAKKSKSGYELLASGYNKVLPYQTYAMHHGASRETNFSPTHDLNHYDTIHAEMMMLVQAQKEKVDLKGTTLFVNLMPCPNCTRTLAETDISEIVYVHDHSDSYAAKMLTLAGKKITRLIV